MPATVRCQELLDEGRARLGAQPDAELLLAHVLGIGRALLHARLERAVSAAEAARFRAALARRAAGEPFAYLTGVREFWSLPLQVGPAVLVPRPETELLVERALALDLPAAARVLDLGTGSGAIAIALAHERPRWSITASDLSADALAVAQANAAALVPGRVRMLAGSWFEPHRGRRFDLIVGNPPYVASIDPALLEAPLSFEPRAALAAGPDGLAALRTIVAGALEHLEPGGRLLLEHGAGQAPALQAALGEQRLIFVTSHRDLAGHLRVIEACAPLAPRTTTP